jgi:hypothetical protein
MPLQTNFSPRMEGMIATRAMMSGLMQSNAGVYEAVSDQMDRRNAEKSAEQVKVEAEKEARLSSFQTMLFYSNIDRLYRECLRRLLSDTPSSSPGYEQAKKFKDRLKELEIDERLLDPKNLMVRAMRSSGYGSTTMARMVSERIAANAKEGLYDQAGAKQAIRDLTAQLAGWDMVDRYAPSIDRNTIPTNETSIATLENNSIAKGEPVAVGTDQNHIIHAEAVFSLLEPIAGEYMKGLANARQQPSGQEYDPRRILPAFRAGIPHLNGHFKEGRRSKANEGWATQAGKRIKALEKAGAKIASDANRAAIQESEARRKAYMAQQQAASQMTPEAMNEQRKNAVTQADIARKDAVASSDIRRKEAKTATDIRLKAAKQGQNMAHTQQNHAMAMERENEGMGTIPEYTPEGEMGM